MAPRSIFLFTLSVVAGLVAIPMFTNLQSHAQFALLLRRMMSEDAPATLTTSSNRTHFSRNASISLSFKDDSSISSSHKSLNVTAATPISILPPPILATDIANEIHDSYMHATNDAGIPLANLSSVDYNACCGLGHRLIRMANAAWIAKRLNLGLHTFWGYCGNPDTEIFQHLFGVQTKQDLENVTSTNQYVKYYNEVPGFQKLQRYGRIFNHTCPCQEEQIQAHYDFYEDLRNRFRYKQQVDEFVKTTFSNFTVLGLHVRAGNGETGDFVKKNRGIPEINRWVKQASKRIKEHVQRQQDWKDPPLLYIATDTPSLIEKFRRELQGSMPVIEFPQERQEEGQGVFFGEGGKHANLDDYKCIRQWENAVADMILLSHSNVLIAGRISSFVQSMPMSLVFGRKNQKVKEPNCELNLDASDMICSSTYLEWCCDIRGPKINPRYAGETTKVPDNMNMNLYQTEERPPFKETPQTNLPYYWKPQGYEKKNTVNLDS